jgi:O-antigen ligase
MLLLYFVAERLAPTKSAWRYLNWAAFALVMVLMQEKVTILTFLILILLFSVPALLQQLRRNPRLILWLGYGSLVVIGTVLLQLSLGSKVFDFLTEKSRDIGLDTLTGRTEIWRVTLNTWRESPFFGYGPHLWDEAFRMKAGAQFMHVGMAHNQYVQSLGEAGLIGLACLLGTLFLWIRYAMKHATRTRWISLGLVSIPFFCAVTEAPFRSYFLGEDFFTLICLFAIMLQFPRMHDMTPNEELDDESGDHLLQARRA